MPTVTNLDRTRRPSLSLSVLTAGPAARIRALLELMRPHVDEIVLAVDRAGDAETLERCADLADRRLAFEFRENSDRAFGWSLEQCAGDWILRLDGDEVPSRALLDALPELVRDRYPSAYWLRRLWLYGSSDQYIDAPPWNIEFIPRLLRNLPGQWTFGGRVHDDGTRLGERRLVDVSFYHADLLLQPPDRRRAKALDYERRRPGLIYDDFPVNAMYVPEAAFDMEVAPVPAEDRGAIAAVLEGSPGRPASEGLAPVEQATRVEVERHNTDYRLSEDDYRASIEFVAPPERLRAGVTRQLEIVVRNGGGARWPWQDGVEPLVRLAYRWRDDASGEILFDGRNLFLETVKPGQSSRTMLAVVTPPESGRYTLEVDVVHEHVRWFGCPTAVSVTIGDPSGAMLIASPRLRSGTFEEELNDEVLRAREVARANEARARAAESRAHAAEEHVRALEASRARRVARFVRRAQRRVGRLG